MAKITPRKGVDQVLVKTKQSKELKPTSYKWWMADNKEELGRQLISTAAYLKEQQQFRYRQTSIYARMYGNMPLFNFVGTNMNKMGYSNNLPIDRPTMNVVQSCVDTKVSRITQNKPRPMFLTDGGDYKERTLAKSLNNFIMGEFYQTKTYSLSEFILRDASVAGTGCVKIIETLDHKVGLERKLLTELLVDPNEAYLGDPRQLYEFALVDRAMLAQYFPKYKSEIAMAEQAFPDASDDSNKSISDQVMVVEGWRLPSGKETGDGYHAIACSAGLILDEPGWDKEKFPFVFLHDTPRMTGFWGQGTPERLMGTQVEINKLLQTISASINLVGVPRVFVEDGSKVVKSHLNNTIGAIVTYRGTKPTYEVAPCVPQELYGQLQRLVEYAYQQEGISQLAAESQKPAGLNSGEALREYDDIQSDRLAALSKRYQGFFEDLAYQIIDKAMDIAKEQGKYETVYPGKDGTHKIDLPNVNRLQDPFVIQCYDTSFLPKDPAARKQAITEDAQAGMISMQEARRLLNYPDLEQDDKLAMAQEERILQILDKIVEDGKYTPPDPFLMSPDPQLPITKLNQYYNLYEQMGLEERKAQMLRDFLTQCMALQQAAQPPPMPAAPMAGQTQGVPQPRPTSDVLPNAPQGA